MTDRGDMKRNTRRRARKLKSETRHNEWGTISINCKDKETVKLKIKPSL